MKTRPVVVAAHNVAVSELPRASAATFPPAASFHGNPPVAVRFVAPAGPMPHEVTARRVRARGRKLRTVGFEKCLVARPILGPPDAQGALEDRSCADRIGDDGSVKLRGFRRWLRLDRSR